MEIVSLEGEDRQLAVPVLVDAFTGVYRWHAKRTLREASWVRAARDGNEVIGVALLDRIAEGVGYVYYIAVRSLDRGRQIGGALLDDALVWLEERGARIAYAVVTEDNDVSEGLFRSRGFRAIERKERGYQEGGLGAWGLRSRMRIVAGEALMGRRLGPSTEGRDGSG